MDHPGRLRGGRAPAHLPGPRLVVAGREERDQVERAVARADHGLEPGLVHVELGEQRTRLLGIHPGDLGLDRRVDADGVVEFRRDGGPLFEVRDHDLRLQGQRRDALELREVCLVERRVADRDLRLQRALRGTQGVDVGAGLAAGAFLRPLQGALDHGEIGEEELGADRREVAERRCLAEATHDDREGLGLAQPGDPVRAGEAARHVDETHLRLDALLRPLHLREHVDPRIGYRHHGDVGLPAVRSRVRERREERRRAAEGRAHQAYLLHGRTVAAGLRDLPPPPTSAERARRTDFRWMFLDVDRGR